MLLENLWSAQPPTQWVPKVHNESGRETDLSPPSSTENKWCYTSTASPICFMAYTRITISLTRSSVTPIIQHRYLTWNTTPILPDVTWYLPNMNWIHSHAKQARQPLGWDVSVTKAVNSDAMVNEANRYNCISSHHTHNYTTLHAWMLNCLRFHVNCKRPSKVILCIWQAVSSVDLLPFNSLILSQRTAFWDDGYVIYM